MSIDLDTIIFAALAFILLARLWQVLGRRNDEDTQRPNPFITPIIRAKVEPETATPQIPFKPQPLKLAPESLAGGLQQIQERDPTFDEKKFLQIAQSSFVLIIEDYAKGDMTRIARLLTPTVLGHFQTALEERHAAGRVMESHIVNVRDVETTKARLEGNSAFITVQFVSHQENTLRDSHGQIIGGEAGKVEEITDRWTFTRDVSTPETSWLLAETGV